MEFKIKPTANIASTLLLLHSYSETTQVIEYFRYFSAPNSPVATVALA